MKLCMGCMEQIEDHLTVCPHCGFNETTLRQASYYLDPGTIIGGRYILGRVLSYGGHTVSYLGMDAKIDRKVIIKEYLPSDFSTRSAGEKEVTIYSGDGQIQFEKGLTNFLNEANRIQHLQDTEGIAQIYDCIAENDTGYVISEYVEGRTLKEVLDSGKKYSSKEAKSFIKKILRGLAQVHKLNIVHCDISPETIMITDSGEIKLLDFGATRYVTTANSKSLSIILKRGYAPEEQYRSRGIRGPWTDVYALGAVMYRMITGIVPQESVERVLTDELKEPSKLGVDILENTENALMNALNVYKEERTPSAEAFLKELNNSEVKRINPKKKANKTGKFPLWAKGLVACLVTLVVVGGGVLAWKVQSDKIRSESNDNSILMNDLSGMTKKEAAASLKDLEQKAQEVGIMLDIALKTDGYVFDLDKEKNGTVASQTVEPSSVLYNPNAEKQKKLPGIRRDKNGNITGTVTCSLYSDTKLHYSDISGLSAYAIAQKLGIDPNDGKHFVGTEEIEDSCYYDLIRLGTPDGELIAEELQKEENQKKEIAYEKEKMCIVYSNIPFFYWETLPDFKQEYTVLDKIPAQDTYIWKNETDRERTGQQKVLKDVSGMVNYDYCSITASQGTGCYNTGDIVNQTFPAGQELDTSKTKLEEALLYVIGDGVLYGGKTGNQVQKELTAHFGDSVHVVAAGSGLMGQPILGATVTNENGNSIDYFRKGEPVTVTLDLKATPVPTPVPQPQLIYPDGGGYTGGGYTGGVYTGDGDMGGSDTGNDYDDYIEESSPGGGSGGSGRDWAE